jgi:active breakpoint cluster region-related protein
MSVFSDFEIFKEMWQTRFPGQRLSDAWEEMLKLDVQASLTRHTQKISDLKKELETEKLYVEYLERLLSDVEKYRESGENCPPPTQNELDNLGSSDRKKTDEVSNICQFI